MRQYHQAKAQHEDALLFFRMGDFYELFYRDAETASRALGIALTSRSREKDAPPMAGVPVRSLDTYLRRLLRQGFKVAICEQVQESSEGVDLLDRQVVRVVTPGTVTEDAVLDARENNYLLALRPGAVTGLSWVDLSTGRFEVEEVPAARVADELGRLQPAELLAPEGALRDDPALEARLRGITSAVTPRPDWLFEGDNGRRALCEFFGVATLRGFGCDELGPGLQAAGAALRYLQDTQKTALPHLRALVHHDPGSVMLIDRSTQAALELTRSGRDGGRTGTVLSVLDRTRTSMGARLLQAWLLAPLRRVDEIRRRQDAVAELKERGDRRAAVVEALAGVQDLERLGARIATERGSARDLAALRDSCPALARLKEAATGLEAELSGNAAEALDPLADLHDLLARALVDAPPLALREGGLIREGFHPELDELRGLKTRGSEVLRDLEQRELKRTGIPSLKVGFNQVFGYYLEVTHTHRDKVPPDYVRKQTLKNAERYITPELKEHEAKVLHADERARALEYRLFLELRQGVTAALERVQATAGAVALLDVLAGLAEVAEERRYARPAVNDGPAIRIRDGRHPVLETAPGREAFVPNDALLDDGENTLLLITGPNMAGKSTYLRQTALIVLLAQVGSFVPAAEAEIGVADRIFTRVGAADELFRGQSTFMVEMAEVAAILNAASDRSVLVLDEVGRGTSTFDGVSIAWAVAEEIAGRLRARTLFATHYHELTALAATHRNVRNLNVAVREWGDEVIFLRKIVKGGADRSYGIHVARLAGVPRAVVERAAEILRNLEDEAAGLTRRLVPRAATRGRQRELFEEPPDPVVEELRRLDLDGITPLQALQALAALKKKAEGKS
jgi:DNA mismatch repair protein MutS